MLPCNAAQAAASPTAHRPQQQPQEQKQRDWRQQDQQEQQQAAPAEQQQAQQEAVAAPERRKREAAQPKPGPEPIVGEHKSEWAPPPAPQPHELPAPPGEVRAEGSGHEILLQVVETSVHSPRIPQ